MRNRVRGLAANGIKRSIRQAAPTPAVTFAVRDRALCGAVMITASHNPPQFNGYNSRRITPGRPIRRFARKWKSASIGRQSARQF